jgi:hypothetical protein
MIKRKTLNQVPIKPRKKIHPTLTTKNRKKPKKRKKEMIKKNRLLLIVKKKVNRLLMMIMMVNSHPNILVDKNRELLKRWLLRNQPDNLNNKLSNMNMPLTSKCGQAFYPT